MYCSSRSFYQTKRQSSDNQIAPHKSSLFAHRSGLSHKPGPLSGHRPFSSKHSLFLQPRLTIGRPDDKYEQEADWAADEVMRMPEPGVQRQVEPEEEEEEELVQPKLVANAEYSIQRQVDEEEEEPIQAKLADGMQMQRQEEETLQTKPLAAQITPLVQRQAEPEEEEEEEPIQTKRADSIQVQRLGPESEGELHRQPEEDEEELEEEEIRPKSITGAAPEVTPEMGRDIQSVKGAGKPLSASERAFFEPRFGADFSNVRVHSDARAAHVARSVNARAFTLGRDVVFGAGQYSPGTSSGRKLLAHELTHVVQQNGGLCARQKKASIPFPGDGALVRIVPLVRGLQTVFRRSFGRLSEAATGSGLIGEPMQRRDPLRSAFRLYRPDRAGQIHDLSNRIFRRARRGRGQRRGRQPAVAIWMHVVGDRGLMLPGATFHATLQAFRRSIMGRRRRGRWTLWFSMHGWDGVVANTTRCRGVTCIDARAFRAVFRGAAWRRWKKRWGPSRVIIFSCNLNAAMTKTVENTLKRLTTKRLTTPRTQASRSRYCNIRCHSSVISISRREIKRRYQYRRLGRGDRRTFLQALRTCRPLGYGDIPPRSLGTDRLMRSYYFDRVPRGWMVATVTYRPPAPRRGWNIPLWRYTRSSRYAIDCQRLPPLPPRAPIRIRDFGRGRP